MHKKVSEPEIEDMGLKCLIRIQDLYPATWYKIMTNDYIKVIQTKMMELNTEDPYEAVIPIYNKAPTANLRVWWLATAKHMVIELKEKMEKSSCR